MFLDKILKSKVGKESFPSTFYSLECFFQLSLYWSQVNVFLSSHQQLKALAA